jgi:hypothetical protein
MSTNQRFAVDESRLKHLGKYMNSIDFESDLNIDVDKLRENYKGIPVGNFLIGNNSYPVTLTELNRIAETATDAVNAINKAYRLGIINRNQK